MDQFVDPGSFEAALDQTVDNALHQMRRRGEAFFFFQAEDGIRDWRDWSSDVCSSDLRRAARTPWRSSSRSPAAVVPPGLVTAVRSSAGLLPLSTSSFADPSRVWNASVSAVSRGRPPRTPASAIASATRNRYAGPDPERPVT